MKEFKYMNKLPYHIVRDHIEPFSRNIHCNNLLTKIKLKAIYYRYEYILKQFEDKLNYDYMDLETILFKYMDDPDHFINTYSLCNCCEQHSKCKPISLSLTTLNFPLNYSSTKTKKNKNCNCMCRHNSRFIYKSFNNINDENVLFSKAFSTLLTKA